MTHIVSNTPVETHVFLSLLHNIDFFVMTPDDTIWRVSEGAISHIE